MREIRVSELKASLSQVLREVARGDVVRVTRRGEPVADIVPSRSTRSDERWEELIAQGRITPATAPHLPAPPLLKPTGKSATEIILADRDEER
jgi:prevent-host-death family protein